MLLNRPETLIGVLREAVLDTSSRRGRTHIARDLGSGSPTSAGQAGELGNAPTLISLVGDDSQSRLWRFSDPTGSEAIVTRGVESSNISRVSAWRARTIIDSRG
jgi:hypothetical protein